MSALCCCRLWSWALILFHISLQTPGWQQTSRDQPAPVQHNRLQPAQPGLRAEQLQLPPGACQLPHAARHRSALLPSNQVMLAELSSGPFLGDLGEKDLKGPGRRSCAACSCCGGDGEAVAECRSVSVCAHVGRKMMINGFKALFLQFILILRIFPE